MENHNAVFLVGGPGSGKDFLLRTALKESGANEIPLAKLITAIQTNQNLAEVNGDALIVNGNADDGKSIILAKAVLEAMGYTTGMVFVYTDNAASFTRSKIVESKRASRYDTSIENMHMFKDLFGEGFFLFDNSADFVSVNEETQGQIVAWLQELTGLVEGYFEKPVLGIRAPKVPHQVPAKKGGHPVPKDHKRIKDGSFYKIVHVDDHRYKDTPAVKEDIDQLFEQEFPTIVDMIAQKKVKGQSQGDKYKGGIAVPGAKATSREIVTSESADRHVIAFSHNNASYRVHKVGCPAAKEGKHRTVWEHEGDAHSALAACHADESEKAGKPTKANAAICKCAKPVTEANQEISVPQTQAKGVKYSKNRPAKGARPPGDTFDSRMGAVPSGGIGLTAYKEEVTPKPLSDIRRK